MLPDMIYTKVNLTCTLHINSIHDWNQPVIKCVTKDVNICKYD